MTGQIADQLLKRVPDIGAMPIGSDDEKHLREIWETAPGWRGWFGTVDHKEIGLRYLVTAFVFLVIGGLEALVIRLQLALPNQSVVTPEQYAQLFTMHGITMIFLYALPILSGFSNYLWPLLLGARDMAFPRLNAFSYWVFLFAGIFLYISFPTGQAANDGWFNYVPFSGRTYNTGPNIDVYALGMLLLGISTTGGAINFVVTLFRVRAPGMSINRMPILVWGTLAASIANLLAIPSVSLTFFLLWMDRNAGTHFFDVLHEGHPLLWQHLFWIFGHPWVYVVVLPAMGIVSDALPTFCRRPLVGYAVVALSTMATALLGFEVWVHHMFASGLPPLALSFFGAASLVISIPSSVAVFAWIATIWSGKPVFKTPFLFFAGFVMLFVIGGVSGVMTAAVSLDWQLTATYFIVAHMHYVLLGINVFPVVGGIYYWFPKFTGRMMSEKLGKWNFWVMFIGFNLGFFPMHIAGLLGMPRRIYTYSPDMGWTTVNMIISAGSFLFAFGVLLFFINIAISLRRGQIAGANPWNGPTLEWSVPSPPPPYNFAVIPIIESRHPLWEGENEARRSSLDKGYRLTLGRETMATSPLNSSPELILKMPYNSYSPFWLGVFLSAFFAALLLRSVGATIIAVLLCILSLAFWLWPQRRLLQRIDHLPLSSAPEPAGALPVGADGKRSSGWWGVWMLIVTEASLFGYLLMSYYYLWVQTQQHWPPEGDPRVLMSGINTVVLLTSSVFVILAERNIRANRRKKTLFWLAAAVIFGILFVGIQLREWHHKAYGLATNLYGSLYFTITGFHMLHVIAGLIILSFLFTWTAFGFFDARRYEAISIGGLYWHFVDIVWIFIFSTFFIAPYLR